MMRQTNDITLSLPDNQHWRKETSSYTGEDLIDAYLEDKRKGKDEMQHILTKPLNLNIRLAKAISEKLFLFADNKGVNFKTIRLKADGLAHFSALFTVSKEDYVSDKFRDIIEEARKLKNEIESEDFYIFFSFVPSTGNLNEKQMSTDGYFLRYEEK